MSAQGFVAGEDQLDGADHDAPERVPARFGPSPAAVAACRAISGSWPPLSA